MRHEHDVDVARLGLQLLSEPDKERGAHRGRGLGPREPAPYRGLADIGGHDGVAGEGDDRIGPSGR